MFRLLGFYALFASVAVAAPVPSEAPILDASVPTDTSLVRVSGTADCDVLEQPAIDVYRKVAFLAAGEDRPFEVSRKVLGPFCTITVRSSK